MSKNSLFLAFGFFLLTLPALAQDFRVQAAAFDHAEPLTYFTTKGVEKVLLSQDQMGLYRYFVGTYNTREEAAKVQADLVSKGFPNAAIIDLAEQRILCGANCPYFRENMIFVQDSNVYNIFFDFGRYSLTATAKSELDKVFQAMRADLTTKLTLLGHTDGIGDKDANLRLSANRARSARNYLLNKGIRSERMSIKVFGESDPITPNKDIDNTDLPEARKLNRRVTLALRDEKGEIKAAEKK